MRSSPPTRITLTMVGSPLFVGKEGQVHRPFEHDCERVSAARRQRLRLDRENAADRMTLMRVAEWAAVDLSACDTCARLAGEVILTRMHLTPASSGVIARDSRAFGTASPRRSGPGFRLVGERPRSRTLGVSTDWRLATKEGVHTCQ